MSLGTVEILSPGNLPETLQLWAMQVLLFELKPFFHVGDGHLCNTVPGVSESLLGRLAAPEKGDAADLHEALQFCNPISLSSPATDSQTP